MTRRRGRRRKKLLDDLKDRKGYCQLKEEALDRTMWKDRFGRGFGPVVWQITDDDDDEKKTTCCFKHDNDPSSSLYSGGFLDWLNICWLLKRNASIELSHRIYCKSLNSCYLIIQSLEVNLCTTKLKTQKFSPLWIDCIYLFCMDLRTNSD